MIEPLDLGALLGRLDGESADALESEILEFKSWEVESGDRKRRVRRIRESVVAMANARGGRIVLGVADRERTRADAIQGVGDLDADALRRDIYDGTDPPILVDADDLEAPEGRLLVLRVPRGLPPHTTTEGVARIRIGKESKPLTGSSLARLLPARGGGDLSAETLSGVLPGDLDPEQLRRLRRTIESNIGPSTPELARLPDRQLLEALGLTAGEDVTLAAVLLLGHSSTIARFVPHHELIFTRSSQPTEYEVRRDLRGPLLQILDETLELVAAHTGLTTVPLRGLRDLEIPDIGRWVAREAILNAVTHRDYFLSQSVHVSLTPERLGIESPGDFIGGVTPGNVIRHPPVRRNPLLAAALQAVGLVNRAGLGVDRIHEELLRYGKGPPRYTVDSGYVRLTLPTRTEPGFVRFVDSETEEGRSLNLDDLLVLSALTEEETLDRWTGAYRLQTEEQEAARRLVSLRRRGYLAPQGRGRATKYRLADRIADLHRRSEGTIPGTRADARRRILRALSSGDRLSNADVRRLTGLSRAEALRVLRALRAEGLVHMDGARRGARYAAGSRLQGQGISRPSSSVER